MYRDPHSAQANLLMTEDLRNIGIASLLGKKFLTLKEVKMSLMFKFLQKRLHKFVCFKLSNFRKLTNERKFKKLLILYPL